jgi:excinuclease UvrABC ATPase subunit
LRHKCPPSTLFRDAILAEQQAICAYASEGAAPHDRIEGLEHIDKIIDIDQSPIGRTPRSNPATLQGQTLQPRDAGGAVQGQVDRRRAGHDRREAAEFFKTVPRVRETFKTLHRVGLDYSHVSQRATRRSSWGRRRGIGRRIPVQRGSFGPVALAISTVS